MSRSSAAVKMSFVVVVASVIVGAAPAFAADTPRPGAADPRIRTVDYDALQVVRVVGVFRTATQILFAPDETILHVALGDTAGWEVAAEGAILFVKPTAARAPTNLIVSTRRTAGDVRSYTFELSARGGASGRATPDTYFVVRFRYPSDDRARLTGALSAEAAALERRVLELKLERGAIEGPRNLAYAAQGSRALQPSEISDNGRFTVLRFPGAQAIPSLYAVSESGAETLVPFDVRGEFVVVHQTAALFRLRRGREVLCLHNLAWSPRGERLPTGTSAPDVQRTNTGTQP